MINVENWDKLAANILKAELAKRGINYADLSRRFEKQLSIKQSTSSIRLKMHRGSFSFGFFLQCAAVIGLKNLRLDDLFEQDT